MTTVTYPFDPTGVNPLCRIVNEQHVLTSLNNTQLYQLVIPSAAPFFIDNIVLSFRNPDESVRVLVEGIDFYFTHHFIGASKATAKPVAGSITMLDKDITGVLRLTYQTIGGVWTLDDNQIAELMANIQNNPRTTAWEQVVQLPFAFPVVDHEWDLVDMVGASEIVDAIQGIRDAVLAGNAGGIAAHVADKNNPHEVTKTQVGLGSVQNYPIATQSQSEGGTNNTTYMTPLRTAQAISALSAGVVAQHATRTDNPHMVTKAQVGLDLVENYAVASNTEAIVGEANNRYMTPLTTKVVVDAVTNSLNNHVNNFLNPHNVSKSQIGLNFVENYQIATAVEAQAGNANDRYMTPLRVKQAIAAMASVELAAHVADVNNPHAVTKSQVGLSNVENYQIATQSDAEGGTVTTKYMTPLRTAQAIDVFIGVPFLNHVNNDQNPHSVTKAQVGLGSVQNYDIATQIEAQAGSVNDKYMTPLRVKQAIATLASGDLMTHAMDTDNPHATTKEQVGLGSVENYAIATEANARDGLLNDLYMTPLRTKEAIQTQALSPLSAHVARTDNPHATTKAQIGLGNVENYVVASQTEAQDGIVNTAYMTPQRTAQAIAVQVGTALTTHIARTDNPHNVTAVQIGAVSETALNTALAGKLDINATAADSNLLGGKNSTTITNEITTSVLDQIGESVTPQYRINTEYNLAAGNSNVWVKMGELYLDDTAEDLNGQMQWIVTGGGYRKTSQLQNQNVTLGSYLISAQLSENEAGDEIFTDIRINNLSVGGSVNASFGYVVDTVLKKILVYVNVPNGHAQVTITNLNPGDWVSFDPQFHGINTPAGMVAVPVGWLHHQDPDLVVASDIASAVASSETAVLNELNSQIALVNADLISLRDEVTAVLTTMYTAISGVAPQA